MSGNVIGFIIWAIVGVLFLGIGISDFFSKKAVGFWANVKVGEITDIKKYNYAVGKLFVAYGIIFILLGLPMLSDNYKVLVFVSVVGVLVESIAVMIIYSLVISKKYRAK